ncbi:carbon-nitrogen hydrolase family protein [Solitalea koreensis]|uniref:Carbon-nitrogen hydrolase n=1 Tax=Solitalea koreensis TaxID=543615 RepID=A0A521D160_9SPHI|nr:carbon-nitrogen hydrolase family protein [Solitalea koreensis]SMO65445.1 Carbon-nitrogen hydrolase [Solitalea koreensis]
MTFRFIRIVFIIVFLLGIFQLWAQFGKITEIKSSGSKIIDYQEVGLYSGKGNLLAIQPYLYPSDYANEATFYTKLSGYLIQAKSKGLLNKKTIVVFPEYTGTWLVACDEKASVYTTPSVAKAMEMVILTHPFTFFRNFIVAPVADKAKYAVFRMKGAEMASIYERVFSKMAKEFKITIVAGSIVLPEPSISKDGHLQAGKGNLYNITGVFGPTGKIMKPLVVKAFPINEEKHFTSSGKVEDSPVFQTSAGRLGVLICADSWYPAAYKALQNKHAEIIAIPSFSASENSWATKWKGYNGAATPTDVDKTDIGKITEADAWLKYSMGGHAAKSGITKGINVFLRGQLWDLGSDGSTIYMEQDSVAKKSKIIEGASLINLWL